MMKTERKKLYSDFEKRDFPFIYVLIALPVLQFAIFWFFVNVRSFTLAFQNTMGNFSFENFKDVWQGIIGNDTHYPQFNLASMLGRSFSLWAIANLLAFPIGVATTYVLYRRVTGHYVFRICYMIPSLVGSVVWVAVVKQLAEFNGPIIYILKGLGVQFSEIVESQGLFSDASTAFPTLCVLTFLIGICGGNAVLTGAYARIPEELFEVGKLDGIGFWKEFFRVSVPCVWPTIATLVTFSLCSVFTADGNVFLYSNGTGEPKMSTMGFYIYFLVYKISNYNGVGQLPYGYPAALGMTITIITLPIVLFGRWLLEKISEPVET